MENVLGQLHPYLAGLLIGFIIGIERERANKPGTQAYGLRTFSFFGLLGAFTGTAASEVMAALLTIFVIACILIGYLRSTRSSESADIGLTTEVAAMVVFVLGYISTRDRNVAFILAALTLGLLAGRKILHNFTRERITQKEADAFVTLIILGVAILPFLPKEALDPWGIFVPMKLGILVFILALVQFLSYALLKIFGEKAGSFIGGLLAGFASSTAAFVNIRQNLNSTRTVSRADMISFGMMAILASAFQSLVIIIVNSGELANALLPSFGGIFLACIIFGAISLFRRNENTKVQQESEQEDPLNLKKQFTFALVLFLVMCLTSLAKKFVGDTAFLGVSFVSGLFELQGVTFAISSIKYSDQTVFAMCLAFIASLVSKALIIFSAKCPFADKMVILIALLILGVAFVAPIVPVILS